MRIHSPPRIDRLPALVHVKLSPKTWWEQPACRDLLRSWTRMRRRLERRGHWVYVPPALLHSGLGMEWAWIVPEGRLFVGHDAVGWRVHPPGDQGACYLTFGAVERQLLQWLPAARALRADDYREVRFIAAGTFEFHAHLGWRYMPDARAPECPA